MAEKILQNKREVPPWPPVASF